jgi:hypothetical protein
MKVIHKHDVLVNKYTTRTIIGFIVTLTERRLAERVSLLAWSLDHHLPKKPIRVSN